LRPIASSSVASSSSASATTAASAPGSTGRAGAPPGFGGQTTCGGAGHGTVVGYDVYLVGGHLCYCCQPSLCFRPRGGRCCWLPYFFVMRTRSPFCSPFAADSCSGMWLFPLFAALLTRSSWTMMAVSLILNACSSCISSSKLVSSILRVGCGNRASIKRCYFYPFSKQCCTNAFPDILWSL
jgi:hypothetical protein